MMSHFCLTCGTTMCCTSSSFPGMAVLKIGTIDDLALRDVLLRAEVEQLPGGSLGWTPFEMLQERMGIISVRR